MTGKQLRNYDVVIIGAGLAGLSLARQLLLYSKKKVLLLEKRSEMPSPRQKVGEATVQLSGYYFSKVLDLEEHLLREHFVKYNLRFYWKTPGRKNDAYEDYSQSYIRNMSNIATYQLNRNKLEGEMLRLNLENPRFAFQPGTTNLDVKLGESGQSHTVSFEAQGKTTEIKTNWVVDTAGRARFLARRMELTKKSPIRHGATFFWVEGLFNIEKLTGLSHAESLKHKNRRMTGHLPMWLATNHFVGEGYWFWVIPLQGKTSLGLVYDREKIPEDKVSSPQKVVEWACREFPLMARDLPKRKIIDQGMFREFSHDCRQTISVERWALSGEAGRFTDPLYSPGGDLITLYNTLITDAILTEDSRSLAVKARLYERLMWAFYEAYVPSFTVGYQILGDQECFAMKYSWELTVYFTFYVFPFINQMFTTPSFVIPYLNLFARLGVLNRNLQDFIAGYYQWKKEQPATAHEPKFFDFMSFEPLMKAEKLFYQVGLTASETIDTLARSMENVERLARFIAAYIYSKVVGDENLLTHGQFVASLELENLTFDPARMRQRCSGIEMETKTKMTMQSDLTRMASDFVMQFKSAGGNVPEEKAREEVPEAVTSVTAGTP